MIRESIKNLSGVEISEVINRANEENETLTITASNVNPCQVNDQFISRVIDECGFYMKWKNLKGGYSYWLFDAVHEDEVKSKDLGSIKKTMINQPDSKSDIEHFGFSAQRFKTLRSAVTISQDEIKEVETVLISHEVYLYKGKRFSGEVDWQRVIILEGSTKKEMNRIDAYQIEIQLLFPELKTQNLLWQ